MFSAETDEPPYCISSSNRNCHSTRGARERSDVERLVTIALYSPSISKPRNDM